MKTSFFGSRSSCAANQSWRCFSTSGRCCSAACALFFFERDAVPVEKAPQHGDRKTLAAVPDQTLLDLEHDDVRRSADQAHEVVVMSFDASGAAIAARRPGRDVSRRLELLDPTHRASDADPEQLGGGIAREPLYNDRLHHPLAKILGKRHSRRLLLAAGIMNQKSADSGIPNRFTSLGYRSNLITLSTWLDERPILFSTSRFALWSSMPSASMSITARPTAIFSCCVA